MLKMSSFGTLEGWTASIDAIAALRSRELSSRVCDVTRRTETSLSASCTSSDGRGTDDKDSVAKSACSDAASTASEGRAKVAHRGGP
jgi:hypothetical protein